jgi:hypothetical protein
MRRFAFAATAAGLLLGACLFLTGCGQSSSAGDRMGGAVDQMSTMDKMGDRMADDKMTNGMMSDGKMSDGKMSDGKMAGGKMSDSKMADGKMSGE